MSRFYTSLAGLSLLLLGVLPTHADTTIATATPVFTATQAIQRAKNFCQQIGQPVTVDGTAQFPVPESRHISSPYWQERWQVIFATKTTQSEVEVVDATGVISYYFKQDFPDDQSPAGAAISEAQAIQIATAALKATGAKEELKFDNSSLQQLSSPPVVSSHNWYVSWRRMGHGVAYRDEHATVGLNAETGEVTSLALMFPSPPSSKAAGSLTRKQADAIAQNLLATEGLQDAVLDSVETKMVQPNTFWQAGGSVDSLPGEAQPAWAYRFQGADTKFYEVWVDTQTGAVLGGEVIGRKGRAPAFGRHKPVSTAKPALPKH